MTQWRRQRVSERAYALWEAAGCQHGNDLAHWFQAEAEIPPPLRVTFDTNVLDLVCRPERFPKDPRQPLMRKVNDALASGQIKGFYSVTMLTIEGIMRRDRADVFADTRMVRQPETSQITKNDDLPDHIRRIVGTADLETVTMKFQVVQPDRKPLHPEVIARMAAAKALGVQVLKDVPRIGAFSINDLTGEYYLNRGAGAELTKWLDKVHEVAQAIGDRGLGYAQVKALGQQLAALNPAAAWFECLDQAADIHQSRAVERAFGEWADGDSVAAHVAYGLDVFCSADVGNSNATNSVLDPVNRAWLAATYGVRFMTFEDLAASIS